MEIRRGLMMGMGNSWKYKKSVYYVENDESYESYNDFARIYVQPLIGDARTYCLIVNVYNNTTNNRAAIYHLEYVSESNKIANVGKRVGGNFLDSYGADFYSGATIEIYISTDVPTITTT